MSLNNIITNIDQLNNEWKEFKRSNDTQNDKINNLEQKMQKIHLTINRPTDALSERYKSEKKFETKSLASVDSEGNNLLNSSLYNKILKNITTVSPFRKLASVERISSNIFEMLIQDGDFSSGWVAETGEREETIGANLRRHKIMVHELYSQPKASQRLLDDENINLEEWLVTQLSESFTRMENDAFINGDGNNKPHGILQEEKIKKIKISNSEKIEVDDLLNLINSLDEYYLANATFMMNRITLSILQNLRDTTGRFIWQPSMSERFADTIFGIPVICSNNMPKIEESALPIILADFKLAYKIIDRCGIKIMQDPYTNKPFIKFYAIKRVGGSIVKPEAAKILQC